MKQNPSEPKAEGQSNVPPEQNASTQQVPSEWELFFSAKTAKASAFVKNLRKGAFRIPSEIELATAAGIIVSRKTGFARLLSLLQAVGENRDSVQEAVMQLGELALFQNEALGPLEGENGGNYLDVGKEWLAKSSKKRLSTMQKELLLTFVLFGWRKGFLEERDLLELLHIAFPPSKSEKRRPIGAQESSPRPTEVLLRVFNGKANLKGLLELTSAWRRRVTDIEKDCALAKRAREEAEIARDRLTSSIEALQREIDTLRSVQLELERRIQNMERQNSDLRTEFQHRLDETRGRLQGVLEGELSRWLQNAYEAATAEPPRTKVIEERLETALATVRRQIEWLRTSE